MDTSLSPSQVGKKLGVSPQKITRCAARLGVGKRTKGGHWRFSSKDVERIERETGVTPRSTALSRKQVQVLAVLSRHPLGVTSARAAAVEAGLSPTAASVALRELVLRGLATTENVVIAAGSAHRCIVYLANPAHPDWDLVAADVAATVPARADNQAPNREVPADVGHVFWNADPQLLDVVDNGSYIARRILISSDANALAWASSALPAAAWLKAATGRGLDEPRRALARNLAAAR